MSRGALIPLHRQEGRADEFSDEALLGACATGDAAALGAIIDRFQRPVYRFVSRLLGSDGNDRDDLVQATFIEVARCAGTYARGAAVRTWILGIAANLTRNQIRGAVRRRRMEAALATLPERSATRPDDEAERRQLLERLGVALAALPIDLREAFVLCDLEEVPCREAASALGVREGTIWRRLHQARRALRTAISGGAP